MTSTTWIISIDDDLKDYDEMFIGNVRDGDKLIWCEHCSMNPYTKPVSVDVVHGTPDRCFDLASRFGGFCSEGEEK